MPNTLGDGPIESQWHVIMNGVAVALDDLFNDGKKGVVKKTGFLLLTFPLNDHDGRCNYISNACREDVIVLLKEQLVRFEGQPDVVGHG